MNFNFPLLKTVRILLFPFSLVYFMIIWVRNRLYDKGFLRSASFNLPVICVGNLAVGGTGKSPMVEYLVKLLQHDFKVATLSRGYKRKTSGYALAGAQTSALEIGDEPMQFYLKFPDLAVAVGEQRLEAIPQLLHDRPDTEVVLLDDAFQHRAVKAGLNIILTDYNNLYTRDWYMPTGDLRDQRSSADRADIIIVTKCPAEPSLEEREALREELAVLSRQHLFFSTIRYGAPYHIIDKTIFHIHAGMEVLLVTGIANPLPLKKMLDKEAGAYFEMAYNDHHIFTIDDLKDIIKRFDSITSSSKILLTTEKDAVRLVKFEQELLQLPLYVIPIEHFFLNGESQVFNHLITRFIRNFN